MRIQNQLLSPENLSQLTAIDDQPDRSTPDTCQLDEILDQFDLTGHQNRYFGESAKLISNIL